MFKESLAGVLEDAKVPMHQHLGALKVIEMNLAKAKTDRETHQKMMLSHAGQMSDHQRQMEEHDQTVQGYQSELERYRQLAKGEPGEAGYSPVKGVDYFDAQAPSLEEIVEAIRPHIPEPIKGDKGNDAKFDKDSLIKEIVSYMKTEKPLDLSHIKGAQSFIMQTGNKKMKIKYEETLHGGGTSSNSSGTAVYNEVVSGSGTAWTLANTPSTGTLRLYANGERLIPGAGNDYTLTGGNITTALSWSAGTLLADYSHT